MLRRLFAGFALCCAWAASAAVLNVEFKFTPYTGDPAGETVDSVAGTARVFLNGVPVIEQEVRRQTLPVMFEEREIGPAVWLPAASLGAADRKLFDGQFWGGVFRIISVTGFSLVAGYITVSLLPLSGSDSGFVMFLKLATIAGVTLATHVTLSGLFGLEEARPFWVWVKRVILRPVKVDYS